MTCALNATHSSQMKTHCDSAGLRQPPSISLRTSFCDLPQNEQNTCSCVAVRDILAAPILASGNMSARTGDVNYSGEADQQFPRSIQRYGRFYVVTTGGTVSDSKGALRRRMAAETRVMIRPTGSGSMKV